MGNIQAFSVFCMSAGENNICVVMRLAAMMRY